MPTTVDAKVAPVIVSGSHRSGSTWVGRLLAAADELHYVQEPFNIVDRQHWMRPRPPRQFLYVNEENEADWLHPVQRVLELRYPLVWHLSLRPGVQTSRRITRVALDAAAARRAGCAAMVKDPIAIFSVPWLMDRFGLRAVVLVRDAVAFAGSLKERGWTFDFRHWSDQPLLMRDRLSPWAGEIRAMVDAPGDVVDQAILQWNAMYSHVERLRRERPEAIVVDYETIASNPLVEVEALYSRLGLRFGDAQRRTVVELSSRGAGDGSSAIDVRRDSAQALETWRTRLTPDEVERVRVGTAVVAASLR